MGEGISGKISQMTRKLVIGLILKGGGTKELEDILNLLIFLNPEDSEILGEIKNNIQNADLRKGVGYLGEYSRRKLQQLTFEMEEGS